MSFHPRITKNEDPKHPAGRDNWGFGGLKGNSISEASAEAIKNYKPGASMALQYQSAGAAQDLLKDGSGYYYMPDGRLVGQYGKGLKVYVLKAGINFDDAKKIIDAGNASPVPAAYSKSISEFNATPTPLTFAELNARAFLTVIRIGEASSKTKISEKPLDYNVLNGGKTFDSYENHPKDGDRAAGAYQFKPPTWDRVNLIEKQKDFSPESQDRAALVNIEMVSDDNPRIAGALEDVYSGNFAAACVKLNRTWTPFPGSGDQSKMTVEQGEELFRQAIVNELAGKSAIETPQGQLSTKKVYKEK